MVEDLLSDINVLMESIVQKVPFWAFVTDIAPSGPYGYTISIDQGRVKLKPNPGRGVLCAPSREDEAEIAFVPVQFPVPSIAEIHVLGYEKSFPQPIQGRPILLVMESGRDSVLDLIEPVAYALIEREVGAGLAFADICLEDGLQFGDPVLNYVVMVPPLGDEFRERCLGIGEGV